MFTLETILGQIYKKGPVEVFQSINKKFTGVGWAGVIVSWFLSLYYAIILCWSVFYFFQSFLSPLPWSREENLRLQYQNQSITGNNLSHINTSLFLNVTSDDVSEEDYINIEYFPKQVLQISEGIEKMGSINLQLAVCLIITYIIIYFCISKGIKSSSKVVYFTAPAPVILLIILLLKVLTLPGISRGLKFLFLPDLTKLFDTNVWVKASNQVVFMISIGIGGNTLFASFRKESEDIYLSSFWIPTMTIVFGLMCSIINFSYLGHFSYLANIPLEKLPLSGTDLAFISYPSALCTLPFPNLWSILFFFMLITLGIDSQFAFNETVSHYTYENFLHKYMTRSQCTITICAVGFFLGLPFVMNGGFYLFELVDNYATLIACFTICLLESYIVTNYVGLDKLKELIKKKTDKEIPDYIYYSLERISPIANMALIIFCCFREFAGEKPKYGVSWPYLIQWIVILSPLLVIAYFYFLEYFQKENPEENSKEMREMSRKDKNMLDTS